MTLRPVRSLALVPLCFLLTAVGPLHAQETVSVLVRFGLLDTAETRWDGSMSVSAGELLRVSDWHPRPENVVDPGGTWQFSTHKGANYNWKAYENAAPFRRNDDIINLMPKGIVAFPGSGITANLVDKARQAGIPVMEMAA